MRRFATMSLLMLASVAYGQGLQVQFGMQGLERLTYHGQVLSDTMRWPDDRLHIWHMKCLDVSSGKARTDGEYGWGENNQSRSWDAASKAWNYSFVWGSMRVQYLPRAEALDIRVTESNRPTSGIVLDGASIYPVTLHPSTEAKGVNIVNGMEEPVAVSLVWPGTSATVVTADGIYGGFQPAKDGAYAVLASNTGPDSLPEAAGLPGARVQPGASSTFTLSLRFDEQPSQDIFHAWVMKHAPTLNWSDRRILGTVYLASSGQGDKTHRAGFPTNPRRYFNDASVDVTTTEGLRLFQARVLANASEVVENLRRMNAQGAIVWDIEGQEYPQSTSYICAPDEIARVAPEMESVVQTGLPYAGMRLDDAYFRTLHEAGFKVGVCVRPQRLVLKADGSAQQQFLSSEQVAAELIRKMRYAHDRWGATIFYLDSTVREGGWPLPSETLEQAAHALPDSLLIPEESWPRAYGSTAPFRSFLFHNETGVPAGVRLFYPSAFAANMINDVDPAKLAAHRTELMQSVRQGDILMIHADTWHANNTTVMQIYHDAGQR